MSPLYQRLREPNDLRGGPSVEPVAYEMDDGWNEPQCVAWLVTALCRQLATWRVALRKRLKADVNWKTDEHYSRLAGHGLQFNQ